MHDGRQHIADRFRAFAAAVLEPAVHPQTVPLEVAVYQCDDPIPHDLAVEQDYTPVALGWRWGPIWSTAWFRLRGTVPPEWAGRDAALRFSCGTEALLWRDATPFHGLDAHRETVPLLQPARGGEPQDLLVEAACNGPLGVTTFWWDERETATRWREPCPGRLERAELALLDSRVWTLWRTFGFAAQLIAELDPTTPRYTDVRQALEAATAAVDPRRVRETAGAALTSLTAALRSGQGAATRTVCHAVGHAHIDTAWLWPLRETRRKCQRTFATALRLMERFNDFRFLCSQAQQYAWLERDAPALFEQIRRRVHEGRWEAAGAMWVEPDCNLPDGESLVRQILYGTRYWRSRFGDDAPQQILYLPDTFGFCAALPQIMRLSGLDTFVTNKLAWNQTNRFPHVTFTWRGLDGSAVLAHCLPGEDYNATNTPAELRRGEANACGKGGDVAQAAHWLQPFGYGDGGGGPTDWSVHAARLARDCEGLPEVRLSSVHAFRRELHAMASHARLPIWDGELYLELHRGTYTSQGWLKRANRRGERLLRMAEWLSVAGPFSTHRPEDLGGLRRLDDAWRLLLLNQFHDILPGTSIGSVYDEARAQLRGVHETAATVANAARARWASRVDSRGRRRPALIFNETSWPRSGVVDLDGEPCYAADVPALGMRVIDRDAEPEVEPARVEGTTLRNGLLTATVDDAGRIIDLRRHDAPRGAVVEGRPLNQLVMYDDLPRRWEAWDVDEETLDSPCPADDLAADVEVMADGPLRAALEVTRLLGDGSSITQRFVLEAGSPRLDVVTRVEWNERRRLLRALFPIDVRATQAACGTPFGHVVRSTHRNTPWERARFEFCAHGWVDLAEPGLGVALLTDGIYGHSAHDGVLGLSLLRSPLFPDPEAERGVIELTYALLPHGGDWRDAGVDREAARLRASMWGLPLPPGQAGPEGDVWAPMTIDVDGSAGVEVAAVKRAEDDDERLIIRLVEIRGGRGTVQLRWSLPVREVEATDLLEQPLERAGLHHDDALQRTTLGIKPFEIVTLAAIRAPLH